MKQQILRFNGARVHDPTVDAWFKQHPGPLGDIARHWFQVMRNCGDEVRELLHDGCPTTCLGDAPFAYVAVFKAHVNVGFFHGAYLRDPSRLLQGSGKRMRHIKLTPEANVDSAEVNRLIQAAWTDIKFRVENA